MAYESNKVIAVKGITYKIVPLAGTYYERDVKAVRESLKINPKPDRIVNGLLIVKMSR